MAQSNAINVYKDGRFWNRTDETYKYVKGDTIYSNLAFGRSVGLDTGMWKIFEGSEQRALFQVSNFSVGYVGSVTFYYYTVRFAGPAGLKLPDSQIVFGNNHIAKPVDPQLSGCTFAGWYPDSAGTAQWDFPNNPVLKTMTLRAKFASGCPVSGIQIPGRENHSAPMRAYFLNHLLWIEGCKPGTQAQILDIQGNLKVNILITDDHQAISVPSHAGLYLVRAGKETRMVAVSGE